MLTSALVIALASVGVVLSGLLLAVISASELVFLSLTEAQIRRLNDRGNGGTDRVVEFVRSPYRVIMTSSLASGVFSTGAILGLLIIVSQTGPLTPVRILVPGLAAGLLLAVLGRAIPRAMVSVRPEKAAFQLVGTFTVIELVFRPLAWAVQWLQGRVSDEIEEDLVAAEEFKAVAEDDDDTPRLEDEKRELLHSIFEFGETTAREVMVPRIDMIMADAETTLDEVLALIAEHGHSRIPIWGESVDQILGAVHVKELATVASRDTGGISVHEYVRPVMFVPETKRIDELLREFQDQRSHLAIVVDEYGGTSGMVTLEDVLEEIVGEIEDEYDTEETLLEPLADGSFRVAAKIDLDDLNEEINVKLPTENSDTLGGFIYELVGKVPTPGETVSYQGLRFVIDRVHRQRIVRVRIQREEEVRT